MSGTTIVYAEGRESRHEKWLGFAERWDYDELTGVVDVNTYDNRTAGVAEHFPFAFLPAQQIRITRDNGGLPTTYDPHRFVTTNNYQEVANLFVPSAYSARLTDTSQVEQILNGVPPALRIRPSITERMIRQG